MNANAKPIAQSSDPDDCNNDYFSFNLWRLIQPGYNLLLLWLAESWANVFRVSVQSAEITATSSITVII